MVGTAVLLSLLFLLFMAGLYHGILGVTVLLRRAGIRRTQLSQASTSAFPMIVAGLGAIGACLALMGFGGVLFDIPDPRDNDYARQYSEMLILVLPTVCWVR
jgi:hypothetical protein